MNATDTANNARDRVTQFGKDARDELREVLDKTADQVQPAADRLASSAKSGLKHAGETIDSASVSLAARGRQLANAYGNAAESGASFVRRRPGASLLIAAAAGYGISRLFGSAK